MPRGIGTHTALLNDCLCNRNVPVTRKSSGISIRIGYHIIQWRTADKYLIFHIHVPFKPWNHHVPDTWTTQEPATSKAPTPASPRPRNFRRCCGSMTWLLTDLLSLIFFVGKNKHLSDIFFRAKHEKLRFVFLDKGLRFCFLGYTNWSTFR